MIRALRVGSADRRRFVTAIARFREAGILFVLLLLIVFTALRSSSFLTSSNLSGIALDITILIIVAIGETIVILTRNIDLSVGSIVGFTALFVGVVLKVHPGTPALAALALGAGVGLVFGLGNGLLVAVGQVPAIIATLGTFGIYRGLVFIYSNGSGQHEVTAADLPNGFLNLATEPVPGLRVSFMIPLILLIAAAYWLRPPRRGREVSAVACTPAAARLAGINGARIVRAAFAVRCALAGLGGHEPCSY